MYLRERTKRIRAEQMHLETCNWKPKHSLGQGTQKVISQVGGQGGGGALLMRLSGESQNGCVNKKIEAVSTDTSCPTVFSE